MTGRRHAFHLAGANVERGIERKHSVPDVLKSVTLGPAWSNCRNDTAQHRFKEWQRDVSWRHVTGQRTTQERGTHDAKTEWAYLPELMRALVLKNQSPGRRMTMLQVLEVM